MTEKNQALEKALVLLKKNFGEGACNYFTSMPKQKIEVISSGSLTLDIALGIDGFARGRIIEIIGLESSGKTTLAIHTVANAQKLGLNCCYLDMEQAFDPAYAVNLGVDLNKLIFSQPSSGEQYLDTASTLIESGGIDLVVIDSVATLIPKAEIESAFEENQMELQTRLMSKALRKLSPLASKHNVTIIFINQYREKIGIMYGDSKVPCGGNSLKYYASVRVQMTKKDKIENSEKDIVGNQIEAKVLKNKLSPPYTIASFQIIFGKGIDRISEIINISVDKNIIAKAGAFYSFEGVKLGQGFENTKTFLRNNVNILQKIEKIIMSKKDEIQKELYDPSLEISLDDDSFDEGSLPSEELIADDILSNQTAKNFTSDQAVSQSVNQTADTANISSSNKESTTETAINNKAVAAIVANTSIEEIIEKAVAVKFLKRNQFYIYLPDGKRASSLPAAVKYLEKTPAVLNQIKKEIGLI